jgi:hypothetical protein
MVACAKDAVEEIVNKTNPKIALVDDFNCCAIDIFI